MLLKILCATVRPRLLFLTCIGLKDYVLCAWYTSLRSWPQKSQAREPWCDWVFPRGYLTYCRHALTCSNRRMQVACCFALRKVRLLTARDQVELCMQSSSCVIIALIARESICLPLACGLIRALWLCGFIAYSLALLLVFVCLLCCHGARQVHNPRWDTGDNETDRKSVV